MLVIITEGNHTRIAVLSGKGGTGKSLLSANIAAVAEKATYMDCNVEEPNGHLFLNDLGVNVIISEGMDAGAVSIFNKSH